MAELTDREKKIILIKYIIHGTSPYSETPIDVRVQMLQASAKLYGLEYEEQDWLDLGEAILKVQQEINDSCMGFLKTNKELVTRAIKNIGKGNDRLTFK